VTSVYSEAVTNFVFGFLIGLFVLAVLVVVVLVLLESLVDQRGFLVSPFSVLPGLGLSPL
jgi:hypothetical protein